jgi:23S rRNA (adenine1618-N6)-methyltransferase
MTVKQQLHPRNLHNKDYDFVTLIKKLPALKKYVFKNKYQNLTIDFADAQAVKTLNFALLKNFYHIEQWDIPSGYLCPPIPGRVDYIHYLADLLTETSPLALANVSVLDIGSGASCIYPILGSQAYQWSFTASDIDPISVQVAQQNIESNKTLSSNIQCRLQPNAKHYFKNIIQADEYYELTLCNPPFHSSLEEATQGSKRKWKNLGKEVSDKSTAKNTTRSTDKSADISPRQPMSVKSSEHINLNFGGQKAELWCQGGELTFIKFMIKESKLYQKQVLWFTCLVSKKDNLSALELALKKAKASQVKIVNMAQGQKVSRFIAWTFLSREEQQQWCQKKSTAPQAR